MPHVGWCMKLSSANWVFASGYCVCMKHYFGRTDSTGQVRWRSGLGRCVGGEKAPMDSVHALRHMMCVRT